MANSGEILSLYKQDERVALQKLFDVYYEPLLLYCYRLIRNSESAEDLVQDLSLIHILMHLMDYIGAKQSQTYITYRKLFRDDIEFCRSIDKKVKDSESAG